MKILNMRSFLTPALEAMSANGKIHSLTKSVMTKSSFKWQLPLNKGKAQERYVLE